MSRGTSGGRRGQPRPAAWGAILLLVALAALGLLFARGGSPQRVEVRVVDAAGRAVEGARVRLVELADELLPPGAELAEPPDWGFPAFDHDAATDRDGRARFEGLPARGWRAWAWKAGWLAASAPVATGARGTAGELVLVLRPAPEARLVGGVVVDPEGAPVADALVRVHALAGEVLATRLARTDAAGRFELTLEAFMETGALEVVPIGERLGEALVEPVRAGERELRIELPMARRFELTVQGADGEPLEHIRVGIERRVLGRWTRALLDVPAPRAAPYSRVLPAAPFRLHVGASGHATRTIDVLDPAELGEGVEVALELALPPLGEVRGRVTFEGAPVAGAQVELLEDRSPPPGELDLEHPSTFPRSPHGARAEARTDEAGRFALPLERSGTFELVASARRRGSARIRHLELDAVQGADGLQLELSRRAAIRGRVLLSEGRAPERHLLTLDWIDGDALHTGLDDEGRFHLDELEVGRCALTLSAPPSEHEIFAVAPGRGTTFFDLPQPEPPAWLLIVTPRVVELAPGETLELEWDLARAPACRLEGRVLLDGRGPFEWPRGAATTLPEPWHRVATLERDDGHPFLRSRATIGADGRFALAADEPGAYRLRVVLPQRYGPELVLLDRVVLAPGSTSWSHDLATGALALTLGPRSAQQPHAILHRWRGPGELRAFAWDPPREPGRAVWRFPRVVAGAGELALLRVGWQRELLERFELAPGGALELRLP